MKVTLDIIFWVCLLLVGITNLLQGHDIKELEHRITELETTHGVEEIHP